MGTGGEGRGRNEAGTLGAAPSQTRSILGRWLPSAADVIMRPPPSHCVPPPCTATPAVVPLPAVVISFPSKPMLPHFSHQCNQ